MPVSGIYTWSETSDSVEVQIPLKGISSKKVDIFTASTILKVAYAPFLVDLNLFDEIDDDKSKAIVKNGVLEILLAKRQNQCKLWRQLCYEGSKEDIVKRRKKAFEERDEKVQKYMEKAAAKKVDEDRMIFRKHLALERSEQQRIDDIKAHEKKNAEDAMHETFLKLRSPQIKVENNENTKGTDEKSFAFLSKNSATATHLMVSQNNTKKLRQQRTADADLPPPRAIVNVNFKHTPRLFKTPSRESTTKQEQDFIIRNRCNFKKNALLSSDFNIGDCDPMWLKAKGDEFKSLRDYRSAINAYSVAIEADRQMVDVLGSRAECYLQLREEKCCIKDCLDALEMRDAIKTIYHTEEARSKFVKDIYVHLATAYCLNKDYERGIDNFRQALIIDQNDQDVAQYMSYLRVLREASKWKDDGDVFFAEGLISNAEASYSKAINVDPSLVEALINRAACHLLLKNSCRCIQDCNDALKILIPDNAYHKANILATILSPKSDKKKMWICALFCRRSAAKRIENKLSESVKDLEDALQTIQGDSSIDVEALKYDITCLKKEIATS